MAKSFKTKSLSWAYSREFVKSYKSASDSQIIEMLGTQKAALELCERYLNRMLLESKFGFDDRFKAAMLKVWDVIGSCPTDYKGAWKERA